MRSMGCCLLGLLLLLLLSLEDLGVLALFVCGSEGLLS